MVCKIDRVKQMQKKIKNHLGRLFSLLVFNVVFSNPFINSTATLKLINIPSNFPRQINK